MCKLIIIFLFLVFGFQSKGQPVKFSVQTLFVCIFGSGRLYSPLTSIVREPLVAFPLEVSPIKLGALLLTEIFESLGTVLRGAMKSSQGGQRSKHH